jgi:hypothetical protein
MPRLNWPLPRLGHAQNADPAGDQPLARWPTNGDFLGGWGDPVIAGLMLLESAAGVALVAQLDRASASEVEGYRFDPCRGYSTAPGVSARRCTGPHSYANTAKTQVLGFPLSPPTVRFVPCRQLPGWISGSDFGVYWEPPKATVWGEEDGGPLDPAGHFPTNQNGSESGGCSTYLEMPNPPAARETIPRNPAEPVYRAAAGSVRISVAARSKSRVCS